MRTALQILTESEVNPERLHNCHVHGLRWRRDTFEFCLAIQFIVECIEPSDESNGAYRFRVAEADLVFHNAFDPKVSMDWSRSAIDAQIGEMAVIDSRATPTGMIERLFELEFHYPDGKVSLWSTGYDVRIISPAIVSDVTSIPVADGR